MPCVPKTLVTPFGLSLRRESLGSHRAREGELFEILDGLLSPASQRLQFAIVFPLPATLVCLPRCELLFEAGVLLENRFVSALPVLFLLFGGIYPQLVRLEGFAIASSLALEQL